MKRLLWALALGGALGGALGVAPLGAQVKLPPYTREVLPNGTVVYFVEARRDSAGADRGIRKRRERIGSRGQRRFGLRDAELLRRGSAQHTAAQFSEEIDGLGGTFAASAAESSTSIGAEFLSKDFQRGLGLVAEAMLAPAFPEEEVRKTVAQRVDGVKSSKDSPGAAIGGYYRSFFSAARIPTGACPTKRPMARVRRAEIVDYHKRMYVGKNMVVIVAGEFDPAAARARVVETFGAVPAGDAFAFPAAAPPARNSAPARAAGR